MTLLDSYAILIYFTQNISYDCMNKGLRIFSQLTFSKNKSLKIITKRVKSWLCFIPQTTYKMNVTDCLADKSQNIHKLKCSHCPWEQILLFGFGVLFLLGFFFLKKKSSYRQCLVIIYNGKKIRTTPWIILEAMA